jgi:hypothetical protein
VADVAGALSIANGVITDRFGVNWTFGVAG